MSDEVEVAGRKQEPRHRMWGKKKILIIFENFEIFKFQFFGFTPLNFHHLIVKTASPGPEVSVPTLGSWEYGV